jgi:hypothetical protein
MAEIHNCCVPLYGQAFDKVNRPNMYKSLKLLKISTKVIRLVKMTLGNSRAVVGIYHYSTYRQLVTRAPTTVLNWRKEQLYIPLFVCINCQSNKDLSKARQTPYPHRLQTN